MEHLNLYTIKSVEKTFNLLNGITCAKYLKSTVIVTEQVIKV